MAKYTNHRKMEKAQKEDIFIRFAQTIAQIKNPIEAAHFIKDLFSEQESLMLARRLHVADLLDQGFTYTKIKEVMPVSDPTIAKVQVWLQNYGEGFRSILSRARKHRPESPGEIKQNWQQVKSKYPAYFWPSLLLEEIVKSANRRQYEQLTRVLENLKEKTALTKKIKALLRENKYFSNT